MATQTSFSIYDEAQPNVVTVWCSPRFREQTRGLFNSSTRAERAHFANVNELVKRLARGEQLSAASFPKEDIGYAFKSGLLRFYGVYSDRHPGCFVLSHSIMKRHQKLAEADLNKMERCLKDFDALAALPHQARRR